MADLDELALAMPETTKHVSDDGRPSYVVNGKYFCFHREPRRDAVDEETGERLDDVLVFRVDGRESKELLVSDARGIYFTTPHWNGYPAVLVRIRDLERLDRDELRELVVEGWLTRARKKAAKEWLAANSDE
jgi:hypothetical protein